ncbi:MAG: PIN domain-containing protein [Candidatus Micrarchaeota archaeon]|nr:PIN domain-containing protein [Candidatus Micrarchaeota archaeon]
MKDRLFFDANLICYAFDANEPAKRAICQDLIKQVLNNEIIGVVSNQVLGEIFNAATKKLKVTPHNAKIIVQAIIESDKWQKINYTHDTISRATERFEQSNVPFWDLVIIETLKENNVTKIITENERDFRGIQGIKVINPFK